MIYDDKKRIFVAAYANMKDSTKWCQGAFACNKDGYSVMVSDSKACKWCSTGHIYNFGEPQTPDHRAAYHLINDFSHFLNADLLSFNDTNTYDVVLDAWTRFGKARAYIE